MAIDFACGNCGKWFHLGDEMAGNRGRCSGCGEVMRIPGATQKPAPRPVDSAWLHESDSTEDQAVLPRRAPAAAPVGGGSSRGRRSSRRSSGSLDLGSLGDIVDAILPDWLGSVYRFEGGILVAAAILALILSGVGALSLRVQPLAMMTLVIGGVMLLQGFLIRFWTWLTLLLTLLYFYIGHVVIMLFGAVLLILLVFVGLSGQAGPINPINPGVARPFAPPAAPPVVFQPRAPAQDAFQPNADPFPGRPIPGNPQFDPARIQAESRARTEKFQAEAREHHERILREIRERNDQMRQRMQIPRPNGPRFQPPSFP